MDKKTILEKIKFFVLDMDGTFYLGDKIFPDSLRFVARVRETGRGFLFFTNNSSKTPALYIEKLARMGLSIERKDILTSGDVTIDYLKRYHAGALVCLMGTEALRRDFAAAGIRLTGTDDNREIIAASDSSHWIASALHEAAISAGGNEPRNDKNGTLTVSAEGSCTNTERGSGGYDVPEVVVCAFDTELTYAKLERACTYIRNGAVFLATHEDINCPTEEGFIPDCGAMCAAIALSTGRGPKYLGKPHAETVDKILSLTGLAREEIAFIGDRLYTDVAAGVNNGAIGLLVLSGETREEDVDLSPVKPDAVFSGLGELADLL